MAFLQNSSVLENKAPIPLPLKKIIEIMYMVMKKFNEASGLIDSFR